MAPVLAANGEWLAGHTGGKKLNSFGDRVKVKLSDVAIENRPMMHFLHATAPIFINGVAGVPIPFDQGQMFETGSADAKRQSARASEDLNASHCDSPETAQSF